MLDVTIIQSKLEEIEKMENLGEQLRELNNLILSCPMAIKFLSTEQQKLCYMTLLKVCKADPSLKQFITFEDPFSFKDHKDNHKTITVYFSKSYRTEHGITRSADLYHKVVFIII